ncbi:MAG: carboxy terminal-processing peptidase [Lentisphaeria bacterium]
MKPAKKSRRKQYSPSLFVCRHTFVVGLATALFSLSAVAVPEPKPYESFLPRIVTQLMTSQHYTRQKLDDDVAGQVYRKYLNTLDPNHRFFLKSDVIEFGRKKNKIDDYLRRGDLSIAFAMYERLLQRVNERVEYSRKRLQKPFDFTVDSNILIDRSKAPWAETPEELDNIWNNQLKNQIIVFKLMQEKEEQATETPTDESAQDAAEPKKSKSQKNETPAEDQTSEEQFENNDSPEERTLKMQERYLHYLQENDSIDIVEMFLGSLAHVYDPHSTYMAPATEEDFDINMSLSLEGIGAVLSTEQGYVKIVNIVPGGPADKDGALQEGDRIVAVRQKGEEPVDVINMPLRKVVQMIRGPKDSTVYLTVLPADQGLSGVPTKIDIVRDKVELKAQEAKAEIRTPKFHSRANNATVTETEKAADVSQNPRDDRFMVLTLPSFYADFKSKREGEKDYKRASQDVKEMLVEAQNGEIDGLVLDLRGNGGGGLEEAIKIAGFFFRSGPVVQVRNSFGKTKVYPDPNAEIVYEGPVIVLVDRLSASASEIVAAALKDHHRAVILGGSSTHGKGTVQTVFGLNRFMRNIPKFADTEFGSLKFTVAKFYRANGDSTQRRGVPADIQFPSFLEQMELGEASMENALAWDQIKALDIESSFDVRPFIPALKKAAQERLESNQQYLKLQESVKRFARIKQRKTLPLNLEKRRKMHKEEEQWLEEIREQTIRSSPYDSEEKSQDDENAKTDKAISEVNDDLVLEEALRILSDLAWMQQVEMVADPADSEPKDKKVDL